MEFGASIFFTDYSITPTELAAAMEERGFDSVWAAEHSHIPVPRRTRADSELGKRYYDVMDPFVTLTAAACATKRLKIATGICLVIQRDTIQTQACCLARSGLGRTLPVRDRRRMEPGGDREPRHGLRDAYEEKMREQIEAMKAIWTETKPEYHGEVVDFGTIMTWPKPLQKPHPPVILGGAFPVGGAARDPLRRRLVP